MDILEQLGHDKGCLELFLYHICKLPVTLSTTSAKKQIICILHDLYVTIPDQYMKLKKKCCQYLKFGKYILKF